METTTPRAWIGCLHCYNSGRLVGEWFTLSALEDTDLNEGDISLLTEVHRSTAKGRTASCEELWVLDHEALPTRGEMSPSTALEWMQLLDEIEDHKVLGFYHFINIYHRDEAPDADLLREFEERFEGCYEDLKSYAWDEAEREFGELPDRLWGFFDIDHYVSELRHDHSWEHAGGSVYIFRDY